MYQQAGLVQLKIKEINNEAPKYSLMATLHFFSSNILSHVTENGDSMGVFYKYLKKYLKTVLKEGL